MVFKKHLKNKAILESAFLYFSAGRKCVANCSLMFMPWEGHSGVQDVCPVDISLYAHRGFDQLKAKASGVIGEEGEALSSKLWKQSIELLGGIL